MTEATAPNQMTLVKYDNPVLVTVHDKKGVKRHVQPMGGRPATPGFPQAPSIPGLTGQAQVCVDAGISKKETEEILNAILPPKEWEEDGKLWRQMVSSVPATRVDVINLQEHLDMRLKQRQARETGICPIRRELYSQCFDELIRQVTINCAERGLLLLRVRDEIRMTLAAYQAPYESSTAYGMRKALMAESGKSELEAKIAEINEQRDELERQIQDLKLKIDQLERKYAEQKDAEEKKHSEEIQFLKRANQQLKQQLEGIIAPKKG